MSYIQANRFFTKKGGWESNNIFVLNAHSRELGLIMSWGTIIHQLYPQRIFLVSYSQGIPRDFWSSKLFRNSEWKCPTQQTLSYKCPAMPPASKVLCSKCWQKTQENTSLWSLVSSLYSKKSALWPELKIFLQENQFLGWWRLLSFAFRKSALTYHWKWPFSWKTGSPSILCLWGTLCASPQIANLCIWYVWDF